MLISLYYILCHQLRVYKDHFIINHDVFRKVYKVKYKTSLKLSLKLSQIILKPFLKNLSLLQKQNEVIIKLFGTRTNF